MEHMVIFERYLGVDGPRLRIGGVVTRDVAHYKGVPHGAVQVAVVVNKNAKPHILLHKRSRWKKISPNTWDICGGHVDANGGLLTDVGLWDDQAFIKDLFAKTALREANEEICIIKRPDFKFDEKHLRCFGGPGVFESASENKEFSTLYLAFVPETIVSLTDADEVKDIFKVVDSVGIGGKSKEEIALELRLVTLIQLVREFGEKPEDYADGVARVLSRAVEEPGTGKALIEFLEEGF